MTTHTTANGSTIQIDGTAVTITSKRGITKGTLVPGAYLKPLPETATDLIAAAKKQGIDSLYGWWEGKTMSEELALILNAAIAEITPARTQADGDREAIDVKRSKMVADIQRGLIGPDSEAAHDCYDIDMNRVERWYRAQIASWEAKYPVVTAARQAVAAKAKLEADIFELEYLAKGALFYDADGSINPEEQQARHDEYMAKAAALRASL